MPHFTTADGVRLFYTDQGSGIPLLCLSGLTRDHRDFLYLAPHMQNVRMICLDYRGRGQSDWTDWHTYTVPQEGQDALALLDHLGLDQAAILGTSRGGLIAMGLSAMAPSRLLGVVLNDIGPELAQDGLDVIKGYLGKPPIWTTLAEAAAARPSVMAGFANVPDSRWASEVAHFYRETDSGLELSYDPALRNAVLQGGAQPLPDLWPFFDALRARPAAALRGANSDLLSSETFQKMRERNPDMVAAEVPDRGHVPFLDEPEALGVLRRWLDLVEQGGTP